MGDLLFFPYVGSAASWRSPLDPGIAARVVKAGPKQLIVMEITITKDGQLQDCYTRRVGRSWASVPLSAELITILAEIRKLRGFLAEEIEVVTKGVNAQAKPLRDAALAVAAAQGVA